MKLTYSLDFGKEIGTFLQGYIEYFVNLQHQNAGYKNTDQIEFLFPFGSDNNQSCVTKGDYDRGSLKRNYRLVFYACPLFYVFPSGVTPFGFIVLAFPFIEVG